MISGRITIFALHFGRVLLASLFVLGGINKILTFEATAQTMTDMGFPLVSILLPATIALELGGGLVVAIGLRGAALSAAILIFFTLLVNLIFHRFWEMTGDIAQLELSLFFKNVSLAGGLLYVAAQSTLIRQARDDPERHGS